MEIYILRGRLPAGRRCPHRHSVDLPARAAEPALDGLPNRRGYVVDIHPGVAAGAAVDEERVVVGVFGDHPQAVVVIAFIRCEQRLPGAVGIEERRLELDARAGIRHIERADGRAVGVDVRIWHHLRPVLDCARTRGHRRDDAEGLLLDASVIGAEAGKGGGGDADGGIVRVAHGEVGAVDERVAGLGVGGGGAGVGYDRRAGVDLVADVDREKGLRRAGVGDDRERLDDRRAGVGADAGDGRGAGADAVVVRVGDRVVLVERERVAGLGVGHHDGRRHRRAAVDLLGDVGDGQAPGGHLGAGAGLDHRPRRERAHGRRVGVEAALDVFVEADGVVGVAPAGDEVLDQDGVLAEADVVEAHLGAVVEAVEELHRRGVGGAAGRHCPHPHSVDLPARAAEPALDVIPNRLGYVVDPHPAVAGAGAAVDDEARGGRLAGDHPEGVGVFVHVAREEPVVADVARAEGSLELGHGLGASHVERVDVGIAGGVDVFEPGVSLRHPHRHRRRGAVDADVLDVEVDLGPDVHAVAALRNLARRRKRHGHHVVRVRQPVGDHHDVAQVAAIIPGLVVGEVHAHRSATVDGDVDLRADDADCAAEADGRAAEADGERRGGVGRAERRIGAGAEGEPVSGLGDVARNGQIGGALVAEGVDRRRQHLVGCRAA